MTPPTPQLIRSTHKALGLTQTQAAAVIYKKHRFWQHLEAGERVSGRAGNGPGTLGIIFN